MHLPFLYIRAFFSFPPRNRSRREPYRDLRENIGRLLPTRSTMGHSKYFTSSEILQAPWKFYARWCVFHVMEKRCSVYSAYSRASCQKCNTYRMRFTSAKHRAASTAGEFTIGGFWGANATKNYGTTSPVQRIGSNKVATMGPAERWISFISNGV